LFYDNKAAKPDKKSAEAVICANIFLIKPLEFFKKNHHSYELLLEPVYYQLIVSQFNFRVQHFYCIHHLTEN
jgi:hypothetical protein